MLANAGLSFNFESITFSDSTTLLLGPSDIVVLVGPNNSGKSQALRDLRNCLLGNSIGIVIESAKMSDAFTSENVGTFIRTNLQIAQQTNGNYRYSGYGVDFQDSREPNVLWPRQRSALLSLFCLQMLTESRITDSNPVAAIDMDQSPSHPIHILYRDDEVADRMAAYFKRAFRQNLTVHLRSGSSIPLMVGERPAMQKGEDRASSTYWRRLMEVTLPLEQQGDGMRSFASVILHLLAPGTPSILLLDEPEAFLHPPQARLLGELIAREKPPHAQLFVATHSPDVIQGLINAAPRQVRLLRVQRVSDGNINYITELENEKIQILDTNPAMKYTSVMSGIFHQRVIICEGNSDCLFYSSIIDLPEVNGGTNPDVLFVNAGGKQNIASLAEMLVSLGVPVDVIADIDVIRDEYVIQQIISVLGGDWSSFRPLARTVDSAIRKGKGWKNAGEVKKQVNEIMAGIPLTEEVPRTAQRKIDSIFREATPWGYVKSAGESAIPNGMPTQNFRDLKYKCKQLGLWIVPVGELEGFCTAVSKSGWTQQVLENYDLTSSGDLEDARDFVREIWTAKVT